MKTLFARHTYLLKSTMVVLIVLVAGAGFFSLQQKPAQASSPLIQISHDPYTNSTSQHRTQVEPDTVSFGPIVVSAFQSGRFFAGGGSSNISWAASFDAGRTWQTGNLPGITIFDGGTYGRVSDSVVSYDLAHQTWLIFSLAIQTTVDVNGSTAVIVSRSHDGLHWSKPVVISASGPTQNWDKDDSACDQNPLSPFFGRCYAQWDDVNGGTLHLSFSTDGGLTWSPSTSPANQSFAAEGGPLVVQPNGHLLLPIFGTDLSTGAINIYSAMSTDGGQSWTNLVTIAPGLFFNVAGSAAAQYRGGSLPTAGVDANGKIYVAWAGCYFEANCSAGTGTDDIVFTTSTNGITWSPLQRIPLDPIGSGVEHLTAGLAVSTSADGKDLLAVTYYYLPNPNCTTQPCQLFVGFASSTNGGTSWGSRQTLAGPTNEDWYANTDAGFMTGDYIATTIALNRGVTVVPVARAPKGQRLDEAMYAASLEITGGSLPSETLAHTAPILSTGEAQTLRHRVGAKNEHYHFS